MAKATEKDIVIRFTGKNLLGPTIQGLQKQLIDAAKQSQRYSFIPVGQALNAQYRERFEIIRRSEEKALKLRQFYARKQAELDMAGGRFGGGAAKKAFGAAGLAAGMVGESFGGTAGKVGSAIGNIGGAAAMGGMAAGPWGAAIFGGIAALKEFKNAVDGAAEAANEQKQAILDAQRQAVVDMQTRMGETTGIRQELVADKAQTPASIRKRLADAVRVAREREESAKQNLHVVSRYTTGAEDRAAARQRSLDQGLAMAERNQAEQELAKVDQRMFFTGARNVLGLSGRNALGGFGGAFGDLAGMARGAAQPGMLAAQRGFGQFMADARLNMDMRSQTLSPGGQLRDQIAELEGMRGRLSPQNYAARRRQLYMGGVGQLPGRQETPGLVAAVSRTSTRGPEQKLGDEMSKFRREAKKSADDQLKELRSVLSELRGEGDQGV